MPFTTTLNQRIHSYSSKVANSMLCSQQIREQPEQVMPLGSKAVRAKTECPKLRKCPSGLGLKVKMELYM
jgi:hypothetical protein